MKKQEQPIKEESYKYSKDKSITITKSYYKGKTDTSKETTKYTAQKEDKIAKGFPTEDGAVSEIYRKFKSSNNNNQKKQIMSKSVEELTKQLELAKKGLTKDQIKNNPVLKESLEEKIAKLEAEIKEASKPSKEKVEKPAKEKPAKEKPTKEKVEKPKKEKEDKPKKDKGITSGAGLKVGEMVQFEDKATGKTLKGELVKLELCSGQTDVYNAYIQVGKEKKKVRAHKVSKVK